MDNTVPPLAGWGLDAEHPRENDCQGNWRGGRPPDLPGGREQYRGEKFQLLRDAVRAEADIRTSERK